MRSPSSFVRRSRRPGSSVIELELWICHEKSQHFVGFQGQIGIPAEAPKLEGPLGMLWKTWPLGPARTCDLLPQQSPSLKRQFRRNELAYLDQLPTS